MKTKTNPWSSKTFLLADAAAIFATAFFLITGSAQAKSNNAEPQLANRIEKSDIHAANKSADNQKAKEHIPAKIEVASADASPQPQAITVTTYPFTNSTAALEDMSTGTTTLVAAASDDGNSGTVNIGFDYWYDGVRFTTFGANANGFIKMGTAPTGSDFTNSLGSTTEAPKICAYWDDLWVGTNGKVHFKTIGSAPNRKLIVEWQNMTIPRAGAATTGAGTPAVT